MSNDVADFINNNSGNSLPPFKFLNPGDSIVGTVTRSVVKEVPDLKDRTQKVKTLILELKTDQEYTQPGKDRDGAPIINTGHEWSVWVKAGSVMLTALAEALKAGEGRTGAPFEGDRIAFEFTGTEPSKTVGFAPKKLFKCAYKPAVSAVAVSIDDL
jgi:hypothetical protein